MENNASKSQGAIYIDDVLIIVLSTRGPRQLPSSYKAFWVYTTTDGLILLVRSSN